MTADWSEGYVAEIGYTYGYYTELNPLRARLALLNAGIALPKQGVACELGFGQGLSVNLHAAATSTNWFGTDFNPSHAGFAQDLATASGADAALFDDSFADFCSRTDLPDFDYIGLHGIWSWVSEGNRALLVDFLRRKLKAGGVAYISYNTLPGWSAFAPMRHIITLHTELFGAKARGIVNNIDGALGFAEQLMAVNPAYLRANPQAHDRLKKMKDLNRSYLAHEYLNDHWYPMHFSTIASELEPAKLQYACSANYLDLIPAINLSSDQQALLNDIPDATFRESVRDFMTNQQFRKDFWVKGSRKITGLEQIEALRKERVVLVSKREDISLKITTSLGEANMNGSVYLPILDLMSDHKIRTLGQIEQATKDHAISFPQIMQAIIVLTGGNHLAPANDDAVITKSKKQTDLLNSYILSKARSGNELLFLASPVTGGGVTVPRFHQLFMIAISQGKKAPQDWAEVAWQILSDQGQRIMKDGKAIESSDENVIELENQAKQFALSQLPILRALQVL
jgi:SAM-dependent methyltransferase